MTYNIIGKNITTTKSINEAIVKSLTKLDKFFYRPEEIECRVVVRTYRLGAKIEVTIYKGKRTFRAKEKSDDLYKAINLVADKLESQLETYKRKKLKRHNKHTLKTLQEEETEGDNN